MEVKFERVLEHFRLSDGVTITYSDRMQALSFEFNSDYLASIYVAEGMGRDEADALATRLATNNVFYLDVDNNGNVLFPESFSELVKSRRDSFSSCIELVA